MRGRKHVELARREQCGGRRAGGGDKPRGGIGAWVKAPPLPVQVGLREAEDASRRLMKPLADTSSTRSKLRSPRHGAARIEYGSAL